MSGKLIGRRHALGCFGLLSSSAAGIEFLESWLPRSAALAAPLQGMPALHNSEGKGPAPSPADTESPYVLRFFKPDEFRTVEMLTEMIIPTDDKPGAKEAKVANYIDFVVYSAAEFKPSLQKQWIGGLHLLNKLSTEKYGSAFSYLTGPQREELLTEMCAPEHNPRAKHPGYAFYKLLKSMTIEAFFTSQVGLIDFLEYKGLTFLTNFPGCTHPEHQT